MGAGAVHHGAAQSREYHAVQGVRVAGAPQILHRRSRPLHGPADLPHESVLPYARSALEDHHVIGRRLIRHLRKEILKSGTAVGAHKEVCNLCHKLSSKLHSHHRLCRTPLL